MAMLDYQRVKFKVYLLSSAISGWWFGTVSIFHNIWDNLSQWLSYFSEGLNPPTRYRYIWYLLLQCIYIYVYTYIYTHLMVVINHLQIGGAPPCNAVKINDKGCFRRRDGMQTLSDKTMWCVFFQLEGCRTSRCSVLAAKRWPTDTLRNRSQNGNPHDIVVWLVVWNIF